MGEVTMVAALNAALRDALSEDPRTLVFGEDVGELGGVFRVTEGLQREFGRERVFNTPIAEAGIAGICVGLAMAGWRPVAEMQFDGFSYPALDQVIGHVAKYRERTRGRVGMPVTIRIPSFGGIKGKEHHGESPETYYVHTAGLKVVAPSTPLDAYRLLRLAIAYALIVLLVASAAALAVRVVMQRRRIAERSAALEAANKDLESFSYSVSHDLRAPLRAIDGFARLLEQDHSNKLDAEARRLLGVIRENSGRMAELIDDLLAFSRLGRQTLRPERLDMAELAGAAWGELHAGEATQFRLGRLPPARGDRALLRQVWANLLSNALKYSSKRQGAAVEVSGSDDGREAVYCVSDNGAGFDMRYYDKLFGVFERLHGQHEFPGTGVGLAIVQRIVARHGGRVWAEGKVNEGARFYFSLPAGPA